MTDTDLAKPLLLQRLFRPGDYTQSRRGNPVPIRNPGSQAGQGRFIPGRKAEFSGSPADFLFPQARLAEGRTHVEFPGGFLPGTPVFPGPRITLPLPWEESGTYLLDTRITPTLAVRIPLARKAPRIDGRLDEPEWRSAAELGPLGTVEGPPFPGKTVARAMVKDRFLYIGVAMDEPDMAGQIVGQGPREETDSVIVLLDVDPEDRSYAKITVDPTGAFQNLLVGSEEARAGSAPMEVAAKRGPDRWSVEVAVDLEALGKKPETRQIGFNLGRRRTRNEQLSAAVWQPLLEHDNASFGKLVLGQERGGRGYSDGSRQIMRP